MKKLFFILFIFITLPINSYCQFQIGFKGGYNYFQILDNYKEDPYSKHSYQGSFAPGNSYLFGAYFKDFRFKQPVMAYEICYGSFSFSTKQFQSGPGSESNIDLRYNINYIIFGFSPEFVFGSKLKIYLNPGFFYGRLINCFATGVMFDYDYFSSPNYKYDTLNDNEDNTFNNSAFGLKIGIGLEYTLNKSFNLTFDNNFSYQVGLFSRKWGSSVGFINTTFEIGVSHNFDKFKFPFKSKIKCQQKDNSSMK